MPEFRDIPYAGDRLNATLELADGIAERWSITPLSVKMAREVCKRYGTQTREDESRAIREWISGRVRYYLDPHGAEMVSEPLFTLQHGGDCDDQSVLCAALLRSLGHKAQIAAVQWQGRNAPTHCVCYDLTTKMVLDPISTPPESWPPIPYKVQRLLTRMPSGTVEDLSGFFSKIHKKISKAFQKVFPAKTLLGKVLDPFALTSRNVEFGGRLADVVGTAATLAVGGYAVGAATTGTAGGFWSTAGAGAKYLGAKAALGAKAVGAKLALAAKTMAPLMLQAINAKKQAGQSLTAEEQAYLNQLETAYENPTYADDSYGMMTSGGGSGGSGGSGIYPEEGQEPGAAEMVESAVPWGLLAVVAGAGILIMMSGKPKRKPR